MEIKWSQESMEGNNSMVDEKVANLTSLKSEEEYTSLSPISLASSSTGPNHLPFSLVLFALLGVLCSLLHNRLFSG